MVDDDGVFRALADRSRRVLLDALYAADGQTLNKLCTAVPGITRFGVMKHLAVLEQANLVVTRRAGRSKLHYLNPVPIQQLQARWISKYARVPVSAMVDLAHRLETA